MLLANYNFSGWCYSAVNVSILNPNGTTLASTGMNPCSLSLNPVTLPAIGTYILVIAPQNGIIGSATPTLTLTGPTNAVTMSADLVPAQSWSAVRSGYGDHGRHDS